MSRPKFTNLCQSLAFLLILLVAAVADGLAEYGPPGWIAAGALLLLAAVLIEVPDRVRAKRKPPLVQPHKRRYRRTSPREDTVIIANLVEFDKG